MLINIKLYTELYDSKAPTVRQRADGSGGGNRGKAGFIGREDSEEEAEEWLFGSS